jgi:hypothetical protein
MDEADVLGDRIAVLALPILSSPLHDPPLGCSPPYLHPRQVIAQGRLQVVGTSEDLKAEFGEGHHLTLSLGLGADKKGALELVHAVDIRTTIKYNIRCVFTFIFKFP